MFAVNVGESDQFTSTDLDTFRSLGTELTGFTPGSFLGIDTASVASGTYTYASNIANPNGGANALGIAKVGDGTLILSGNNTMTGGVSVRGGTLLLTAADQIGTGPITLFSGTLSTASDAFLNGTSSPLAFSGGALRVTGTEITSLAAERTTTFTAGAATTFDIADAANTFTVGQVINSGTGSLVKLGPGTVVLTNTNTLTGPTTIGSAGGPTGGILRLAESGRISGTTNAAATIFAGTLDLNGLSQSVGLLTLGGGEAGSTAGVTTGAGTLTVVNTVTYNATNNPAGATIAGNLSLNNVNRTFTINNSTAADADLVISAAITSGSLTKSGSGTLVLSGSNSYAGTTTVSANGGMLRFATRDSLYGGTPASWTNTNLTAFSNSVLAFNVGGGGEFTAGDVTMLLDGLGGMVNNNGLRAGSSIGFDTTNAAGGTFTLSDVVANTAGTGGGAVGLAKLGGGTLVVEGANTYTGTTSIGRPGDAVGGTLRLAATGSISSIATIFVGTLDLDGNSRTLTALNLGGGAPGATAGVLTGSGTLSLNGNAAFDATNNPGGATISGNVLIMGNAARTFTVGDSTNAAADLTISAVLSGTNASAGLTKAGLGTLLLSANNTYQGVTTVQAGTLEFASIADSGTTNFSALGAPTEANGTIGLGSLANAATLRYTGTGHSSNRPINLAGTTGPVTLDASGSGALELTAANTATGAGAKTFTLTGSSTAANSIGAIAGTDVNVDKTGPGTWRLTAASSFTGRLSVLEGTIRAAVGTGLTGNGVFGPATDDALLPLIGDAADFATGQVAVLLENNVLIDRGLVIAPLGNEATQEVILGNVVGTGTFGDGGQIRLGRGVTLQAATGGTVLFANGWQDSTGGETPAVAFNVGAADNAGTVVFGSFLPDTISEVNVRQGTLRLDWLSPVDPNRGPIGFSTPVKLGGAGLGGTLNINEGSPEFGKVEPVQQRLSNLSFDGSDSTVTGIGTLRLFNSGSAAAVNVLAGTGHTIGTAVALDDATTFTVAAGGRLGIAGVISGSAGKSLTKTGPGILELSGANTYAGATAVQAGTLIVNGALAAGTLTVDSGATLMGSGTIQGATSIFGTHAPGNSPGIETFLSDLTYTGGSSAVIWDLRDNTTSNSPLAYDQIIVGGNLDFDDPTILSLDFGGLNEGSVLWTDSFWDIDQSWTLFEVGGTTSNFGNFSLNQTPGSWLDSAGISFSTARAEAAFSVAQQGENVLIVYTVPEPCSLALAALGLAAAAWAARRRFGVW